MISQTAEYALRAIVYLASQDVPQTTAQIAETTQIPSGYLAKIMQNLGRTKLVHAQRGLNGGFTLARNSDELTVLEVINAIDPVRRFPVCPLGLHGVSLCALHRTLDDAAKVVDETFGKMTIDNLLGSRQRKQCRFPSTPDAAVG